MKSLLVLVFFFCVVKLAPEPFFRNSQVDDNQIHVKPGKIDRIKRIVDAQLAADGQFPYQVLLFAKSNSDRYTYICTGSLISEEWVLTAAHCSLKYKRLFAKLGIVKNQSHLENDEQLIRCTKIIKHENYTYENYNNDIALVRLAHPARLTDTVKPVKLASGSETYAGITAVFSGWEYSDILLAHEPESAGTEQNHLIFVELPVISNAECRIRLGGKSVYNSTLCTGSPDMKTSCIGESGGPLVFSDVQIGISSYESESSEEIGCLGGIPAVFTRVSFYAGWIYKNTLYDKTEDV